MKQGKLTKSLLSGVLVAVALALVAMFAFSQVPQASAVNGDTPEGKWQTFKQKVEAGENVDLDEDLVAFSQIDITKDVKITSSTGNTIYREAGNVDFPVFNVTGGTLELGDGLKISGKKVGCETASLSYSDIKPGTTTVKEFVKTSSDESLPEGVRGSRVLVGTSDMYAAWKNGGSKLEGVAYINRNSDNDLFLAPIEDVLENTASGNKRFKDGVDQTLYAFNASGYDTQYSAVTLQSTNSAAPGYVARKEDKAGSPLRVMNEGMGLQTSEKNGNYFFLLCISGNLNTTPRWVTVNENAMNNANDVKLACYSGMRPGINNGGNILYYYVEQDVEVSTYAVDGLEGSPFETEQAAKDAIDAYNASNTVKLCDSNTNECGIYAESDFASGELGSPRGFFVQVGAQGAVKVAGATLSDFVTAANVSHVSPIAVNGGSFEMTDGAITGNAVGYSAENKKSTWQANTIGKDKGDGSFQADGEMAKWAKTDTAGAVILTNAAKGTVTGGSISNNRADTGAIVVEGAPDNKDQTVVYTGTPSTLTIDGNADISSNIGVHHAGAVFIYNGGYVQMNSGVISKNWAWAKGGAIWACEEVYASSITSEPRGYCLPVGEATFIMNGGKITDNMAVQRAGAIEVMSNHVALLGGEITNNVCRVLGGAIYVEGDGVDRAYRLYLAEGNITGNSAINPEQTGTVMYRTLPEDGSILCGFTNEFTDTGKAGDVSDRKDFRGYYGHGGGIWLCPLGGTVALTVPDGYENNVYIGGNDGTAETYNDPEGNDVLIRPFRNGKVNGISIVNSGVLNNFQDERSGAMIEDGVHYSGPLGLTNTLATPASSGVLIQGNVAADGGGIASNGIVVLGAPSDTYLANAGIQVTKRWSDAIAEEDRSNITVKLYQVIDGTRASEPISEVTLNGIVDQPVEGDVEGGRSRHLQPQRNCV